MTKMNCWEIKKYGRQIGGEKAKELGICPAVQETRVDGVHGGKNGGRCCYAIAGTMCGGTIQGTFASKLPNCMKCDVYQLVLKEEGINRKNTSEIMKLTAH